MDEILKKRLNNTELALFTLWALIKKDVNADAKDAVDEMMEAYFNANSNLGAEFVGEFK